MRKSIVESITSVIDDLYQDGLVDEITMRNIYELVQTTKKKPAKPASNFVVTAVDKEKTTT